VFDPTIVSDKMSNAFISFRVFHYECRNFAAYVGFALSRATGHSDTNIDISWQSGSDTDAVANANGDANCFFAADVI
jgi:hypothetical protein